MPATDQTIQESAATLARQIPDHSAIALAPDYSGCAMAVIVALAANGARGLKLIGVPQLGLQADYLIANDCVESVEAAAVTLGEYGQALNFTRAVEQGVLAIKDSTCPVIHAGLQASEKHIPFMPIRGILGSDLVEARSNEWLTIQNPFPESEQPNTTDPILLVPAIQPDVALFHAPKADECGNVWIGVRRELMLMAHASKRTLVTVEERVPGNFLDDPALAAGTIPELYIDEVQVVPQGAWPVGLFSSYDEDPEALKAYAAKAREGASAAAEFFHLNAPGNVSKG